MLGVNGVRTSDTLGGGSSIYRSKMKEKKEKALPSFLYLIIYGTFIWEVSFSFDKCRKLKIENRWNTSQSETFLTDIQKKILEEFINLEQLFLLEEMIQPTNLPNRIQLLRRLPGSPTGNSQHGGQGICSFDTRER